MSKNAEGPRYPALRFTTVSYSFGKKLYETTPCVVCFLSLVQEVYSPFYNYYIAKAGCYIRNSNYRMIVCCVSTTKE